MANRVALSFLVSTIFLSFLEFWAAKAQLVPATYIFGDSLVDVGNNNYLKLSILKANYPHNGVDYLGRRPTGRFSNGKNAADFLAEKLGLPASPAYLSIASRFNRNNSVFQSGVNFASGGAGIFSTDKLFRETISLPKQVNYYAKVHEALLSQLGLSALQGHLSKSLFGIVIGSNDIFGYFSNSSDIHKTNTPQQYVDSMVSTLNGQMERLYNFGARKFLIVGISGIGCCPSQRLTNNTECNEETNFWALKYNEGLKSMLQRLKSQFQDMNFSYFDTYSVLTNLIQKPTTYGFGEVESACCGLGVLRANVPCLPLAAVCLKRKEHVFWDLYHPTEATASILVDHIFDGPSQYTFPINAKQLVAA